MNPQNGGLPSKLHSSIGSFSGQDSQQAGWRRGLELELKWTGAMCARIHGNQPSTGAARGTQVTKEEDKEHAPWHERGEQREDINAKWVF